MILNVIVAAMFWYFSSNVLVCRRRWIALIVSVSILGFAAPLACSYLPSQLSFAVSIVSFYLYLRFFFVGKLKERILTYCIGYMAINTSMVAVLIFIGLAEYELGFNSILYVVCFTAFCASLLTLIIRTWKSITFVLSNGRSLTFFLLPICQFSMMLLKVFFMSKNSSDDNYLYQEMFSNKLFSVLFLAVLIVSLLADGFFIQAFAKMATDIKEREHLQSLELESRMTYDYIKSMESDVTEMRRYRHDFINLLTTVQLAIESDSEKGKEDALSMVRQMTQEIHDLSGGRYCGNNLVNCILAHEQSRMEQEGIICDFRAELGEELRVSELDLCRLLTNLLDNAAESCCRMEDKTERRVYSNMRVEDGFLYITVRNTCPSGGFSAETDKADKENHGLGLGIMREIVGRYDGELIISAEDSTVTATATLAWK